MTRYRRNRLSISISLLAVLVLSVSLVFTTTVPVEAAGTFDVSDGSIDDDEGYVGDEITITGEWDSSHGEDMYIFFELFAEDEADWPMETDGAVYEGADYYEFEYDFEVPECCSGVHQILICDDNDPNDDVDTLEFTVYPFIELDVEEGAVGTEVEVTGHGWDENESEISIRFFEDTGEPDPEDLDDDNYYELVVDEMAIDMEEDDERYGMWDTTVTFDVPSVSDGVHYVYAVGDVNTDIEADNIGPAQFEVVNDPTIAVSEDSFDFSATVDGADPDEETLEIWNAGPDTINWEVESDEDWLELDPLDGSSSGEHDDVTLSIDISGLDVGDYEATITIEAPEAVNSPETVSVDLEITEEEEEPTIDFSPSSLSFTATEGGGDPGGKTLRIWNSGDGTLDWSVSADADWLTLNPDDGKSTGEKDNVNVSVDISGLDAGEYDAEITIRDPDASNDREEVEVTLEISGGGLVSGLYTLTTRASPSNAGTIGRSVAQPGGGYAEGTAVQLTAIPSPGYAFVNWSGALAGSDNPATVIMSSPKSVIANFVLFHIGALTNVELVSVSPQVISISVGTYPAQGLGGMASGFTVERAYVVTPQGSGTFTLRFTGISAPHNVMAYKVGDAFWTLLPTTVAGTDAIDVTMEVADPIIVLASAEPSGVPITDRISAFIEQLSGSAGDMDTAVIVAMVIVAALLIGAVVVFVLLAKRH